MMNKVILIIMIFGIIIVTGCTETRTVEPVCGNKLIESGEQCDDSDCAQGYMCENCVCNALPQPPALPEG